MATIYVGTVAAGLADGTSWLNRYGSLNAAEDRPIVAGDLVYVAPGVYREMLVLDVSGGAGTPITYIGDVFGEHTDGVGGIVRVTGSDNDQTAVRAHCFDAAGNTRNYRTFRGFTLDTTSSVLIEAEGSNWIVEDCWLQDGRSIFIRLQGATQNNFTLRRCVLWFQRRFSISVTINHGTTLSNQGHLIENCIILGAHDSRCIQINRVGGITVRNCYLAGAYRGIEVNNSLAGGQTVTVNNCVLTMLDTALDASVLGEITEDFNSFYSNATDRTNVNVGGGSVAYPVLMNPALLHSGDSQLSGFKMPWAMGLSQWSQIRAITGSNEPAEDLNAISRPVTAAKNSWGPWQFQDRTVEATTVESGTYARALADAGSVLARRVPATGDQITVTLYVRRETNYAGNLPRIIIKQAGQTDRITTMTAAVDTWEQLTDTFTPASPPGFIELWVQSRNTAVAGNYAIFYDTMGVA